jgi:hypothetical protein
MHAQSLLLDHLGILKVFETFLMQRTKEGANEGCKVLPVLRDQSYENQTLEYQRRARKMKEWLQVRVNRCVSKRIKKVNNGSESIPLPYLVPVEI